MSLQQRPSERQLSLGQKLFDLIKLMDSRSALSRKLVVSMLIKRGSYPRDDTAYAGQSGSFSPTLEFSYPKL